MVHAFVPARTVHHASPASCPTCRASCSLATRASARSFFAPPSASAVQLPSCAAAPCVSRCGSSCARRAAFDTRQAPLPDDLAMFGAGGSGFGGFGQQNQQQQNQQGAQPGQTGGLFGAPQQPQQQQQQQQPTAGSGFGGELLWRSRSVPSSLTSSLFSQDLARSHQRLVVEIQAVHCLDNPHSNSSSSLLVVSHLAKTPVMPLRRPLVSRISPGRQALEALERARVRHQRRALDSVALAHLKTASLSNQQHLLLAVDRRLVPSPPALCLANHKRRRLVSQRRRGACLEVLAG